MSDSHITVVPITCRFSNLKVFTTDANQAFSEAALQGDQPFSLKVTVEFSGPGAIALMPLTPSIQVEFYTKPLSPEPGIVLGKVEIKTSPNLLIYSPVLTLAPPLSIGLRPNTIYCVGAVLRVGAPNWPSLINGYTEELTIEVYTTSESIAVSKTSKTT